MQQRIIYPDKEKWSDLRLTPQEETVYNRFNAADFPVEWEMYIHPHLNGLRPDLVLLHPKFGIAVYQFIKEKDLLTIKDAIESDLTIHNPFKKVEFYERELLEFYCPRLGAKYGSRYSSAITVGLIFTKISQSDVNLLKADFVNRLKAGHIFTKAPRYEVELLVGRLGKFIDYYPVIGSDSLSNLDKLFPKRELHFTAYKMEESASVISESLPEDTAADLRAWLTDTEQWAPLILNKDQEDVAKTRTRTGYRRVKGPAGTGRSVALTARATELDRQGKRVLVCTFNITLVNYLRYLIARHARNQGIVRRQIDVLHFHDWCQRVCWAAGREADYKRLWMKVRRAEEAMAQQDLDGDNYNSLKELKEKERDKVLDDCLPKFVQHIYRKTLANGILPHYDAILVDEGQDFRLSWWQTLREAVRPGGEMLLVADKTQDIYGTGAAWTEEAMTGAGFRARWKKLTTNYRLPFAIRRVLEDFANRFLMLEVDIPSEDGLDLCPVELCWVQIVSDTPPVDVCFEEALRQRRVLQQKRLPEFSDITFLSVYKNVGNQFIEKCKRTGIGVRDTFGENDTESRCKKRLFFSRDSRMKATTLHSFKGLESRHLVIYVDSIDRTEDLALLYTGLTRLKTHPNGSMLTIVSSCPRLYTFGNRNFSPNFREH